jgi:hypothetical protein
MAGAPARIPALMILAIHALLHAAPYSAKPIQLISIIISSLMELIINLCVYFAILLSASIFGVVNFKKLTTPFKILTLFLLYTLISEVVARIFAIKFRNSDPVYHVFVLANYYFYAAIFFYLLKRSVIRRLVLWSAVPFTCFWLINIIFFQHPRDFPSYSLMVSCILYVIYSLILFLQMLETPTEVAIFKQNIFWFNISALFYSVVIVAFFSISGYMVKHNINNYPLSRVVDFITDINYALLGYTLVAEKRRSIKTA